MKPRKANSNIQSKYKKITLVQGKGPNQGHKRKNITFEMDHEDSTSDDDASILEFIAEIYEEIKEIRQLLENFSKKREFLETGIVPTELQPQPHKKARYESSTTVDDKMEEDVILCAGCNDPRRPHTCSSGLRVEQQRKSWYQALWSCLLQMGGSLWLTIPQPFSRNPNTRISRSYERNWCPNRDQNIRRTRHK